MRDRKVLLIFMLIMICAVLVSGCASEDAPATEPGMTGYVMRLDGNRMLVVDPEPLDFSATGGIDEFYNAIWFANYPDEVLVGHKVAVWFDIVADSYPGQSEAQHVEIIAVDEPAGASFDQAEALRRALAQLEPGTPDLAVIRIAFDQDQNAWTIELKELFSDQFYLVEVE